MKITILRANGGKEDHEVPDGELAPIGALLDIDIFDLVRLPKGKIMLVDDVGVMRKLPRNDAATELYHSVCVPGTTHFIRGDVAIVDQEDLD